MTAIELIELLEASILKCLNSHLEQSQTCVNSIGVKISNNKVRIAALLLNDTEECRKEFLKICDDCYILKNLKFERSVSFGK